MKTEDALLCRCEGMWLGFCFALAAGEWIGFGLVPYASAWPVPAVAAVFVALAGYGLAVAWWPYPAVAAAGCALAMASALPAVELLERAHSWGSAKPLCITLAPEGDARELPGGGQARRIEFGGTVHGIKIRVVAASPPGLPAPKAGEMWRCTGWLGGRNDRGIFRRRTLWVKGGDCSICRVDPPGEGLGAFLRRLKASASRRLGIGLEHDEESLALARAVLLGERSALAPRLKRAFVDSGTYHVFAVSGLHVMVIARIFAYVCLFLFVGVRFTAILAVPVLWLYVAAIGFPPSAVRAAAMASIGMSSRLFMRRPDGVVGWAMAFLAVHVLKPAWLMDVGSGLSFVVMLAIVAVERVCEVLPVSRAASACIVSWVAWAAGVPLVAGSFARISLAGFFAGPLVIPLATGAVVAEAAGIAASLVSDRLASYANNCAAIFTHAMQGVAFVAARIPGACLNVSPWPLGVCFAWYCAMVLGVCMAVRVAIRRRTAL